MNALRAYAAIAMTVTMALVISAGVEAQQTESRIVGTLKDSSVAALPGVTVSVTSPHNGLLRSVVTDGSGSYTVTNLSPGTYTLTFELSGFAPQARTVTFNGSLVYQLPGSGIWRVGGILNVRSGVPINVTISRPDNVTVNGVTVTNIPGGNSRGTQRPDLVPGVDPYLKDGVRWLNPAAFATPQPGTFGNVPRNYLRGPEFWQADLMVSKDIRMFDAQAIQIRLEIFNITNRLNYENPAAALPNGTAGAAFTDGSAGTFGYMLGPLNRTVGLGTARQTQISVRYTF